MKTFFLLLLLIFFNSFAYAQPKLKVLDAKKNFGMVKKGEVVKIDFEISNIGNEPLLITSVDITCSCTTAEFDKAPVLPGKNTIIRILFNTQTVYDRQDRTVLVQSNDKNGPYKLRYKGVVLNKK
ncbi:MAG: DUF1573 domain-containing protein [Sphingobacteriaceae bacterium]|nr:DUF1573 domain-containing protein [Sphingobacteriaceae bacterium]